MGNPTQKQIEELVSSVEKSSIPDESKQSFLQVAKKIETEAHFNEFKEKFVEAVKQQEDEAAAELKYQAEKESAAKKDIDPLENFERFIRSNKEAAEYFSIAVLTGDISTTEEPSELVKRQFLSDLEVWIKAGKPRPTMPKIQKGKVKIPTSAYRIRDRKSDKMYIYYDDCSVDGKKEEYFKKKAQHPTTGETFETDEIDDTKQPVMTYNMEFTSSKAQQIIDEANKLVGPGKNFALYFFHKGNKQTISEKNFVRSYEEIAEMIEKKQSID